MVSILNRRATVMLPSVGLANEDHVYAILFFSCKVNTIAYIEIPDMVVKTWTELVGLKMDYIIQVQLGDNFAVTLTPQPVVSLLSLLS